MTASVNAPRQPALDGLRGVSVALVLLFHGGWGRWSGGYLGVSVFFTLSGFLITRLLVDEHAAHGRIDLARFWRRRLRRLLPASAACLSGVMLVAVAGGWDAAFRLDRELIGAATQLANWFELAGSTGYAEQIAGGRGPLDHFWSLAIEEQFYWCWPIVIALAARRAAVRRTVSAIAVAAIAAAPVIAAVWGPDAAYWSTPARIGEIAVGAALAVWLPGRTHVVDRHRRWVGPAALAVIVACAATWPAEGGPAGIGLLPVFALASAALIAVLGAPGRVTSWFEWRPLVTLGAISYGVYLYHWPIFLLLDDVGGSRPVTFAVQVTVSVAVAAVSYQLLEQPIRLQPPRRTDWAAAAFATASLATAALVLPVATRDPFADPERATGQLVVPGGAQLLAAAPPAAPPAAPTRPATIPVASSSTVARDAPSTTVPVGTVPATTPATTTATPTTTTATTTTTTTVPRPGLDALVELAGRPLPPAPERPVRILVVGDSIAWSLGNGLVTWADDHPTYAAIGQAIAISCGFIRGGEVPAHEGLGYAGPCDDLLDRRLPEALEQLAPDVVVLMSTRTDVERRVWDPAEGVLDNADPRFLARQAADYEALTDGLLAAGVRRVVWVLPLVVREEELPPEPMMDPAAIGRARDVIRSVVDAAPPSVVAVDLPTWYASADLDDVVARPDGIHFDLAPSREIADRLLAPLLVQLALA